MLKNISINSLFGFYSYSIDLNPERFPYKFVTGPNGYGKSTILRLLKAIYTNDIRTLSNLNFQSLELTYENGTRVRIEQERLSLQEDDSDDFVQESSLNVAYKFQDTDEWNTERIVILSDDQSNKDTLHSLGLSLFFSSHPIFFSSDQRLHSPDGEPAIKNCVDRMLVLLKDPEHSGIVEFDQRIDVFKAIIGAMQFAHKKMEIEPRYGFRFISDDANKTILNIADLSSGEQHIVIQTFSLLFDAPDDSLVLIDEPELSFHMAWQMEYLKNLKKIAKYRKLQFIIATHSPQVFSSRWDLSVDLFEQANIR